MYALGDKLAFYSLSYIKFIRHKTEGINQQLFGSTLLPTLGSGTALYKLRKCEKLSPVQYEIPFENQESHVKLTTFTEMWWLTVGLQHPTEAIHGR